jgi:hypothetical protein
VGVGVGAEKARPNTRARAITLSPFQSLKCTLDALNVMKRLEIMFNGQTLQQNHTLALCYEKMTFCIRGYKVLVDALDHKYIATKAFSAQMY